jgi:hypothetical protein
MTNISIITAAAAMASSDSFNVFNGTNRFHAPRRIKSEVSVYDTGKQGILKHYNYTPKKGEPRPSWTYRANRRNARKRLLTKSP